MPLFKDDGRRLQEVIDISRVDEVIELIDEDEEEEETVFEIEIARVVL